MDAAQRTICAVSTPAGAAGRGIVRISGERARALAEMQGLTEWSVSLSHDGGIAIAFVVAMGDT